MGPFIIRPEVFEAFEHQAKERFEGGLVRFVRDNVDEARNDPSSELNEFVHKMVGRAEGYGMTGQRDVAVYVTCAYLLGDGFETYFHPARETLQAPIPGSDKANWLAEATVALIDSNGKVPG